MAEKSLPTRLYENVMGTPEQNAAAEKRMAEADKKNPDTAQAKLNRVVKSVTGKKAGGYVRPVLTALPNGVRLAGRWSDAYGI